MNDREFSRYLPSDQQSVQWGWRLMDAGFQEIGPGEEYPRSGHPANYLFDKDGKRILDEYQLIFLTSGAGWFESASRRAVRIEAGHAAVLFPGEWHRYEPLAESGWSEYWMGFTGGDASRIMESFFDRNRPVLQVVHREALLDQFQRMLEWLRNPGMAGDQILASHIPLALALVQAGGGNERSPARKDAEIVARAKARMLAAPHHRTDLPSLAREFGVSYSRFRFAFKKQTGYSPREFENAIRLNRACDLLRMEGKTVSETADALGYNNVYYFSNAFKKQFGKSPTRWLRDSANAGGGADMG